MTKFFCVLLAILAALPVFGAEGSSPKAHESEIAIIHFNRLKEAKVEGTATNITLRPVIAVGKQQSYIRLINELPTPRTVTLRILDLTEPAYGLYIDGSPMGVKSREEIENGFTVSFAGTMITKDVKNYFEQLKKRGTEAFNAYQGVMGDDGNMARLLMETGAKWAQSVEGGDNYVRMKSICVVPTGAELNVPGKGLPKPKNYSEALVQFGNAMQIARWDAVRKINDPRCRLDTLKALTPVDLTLSIPHTFVPKKKVVVTVNLKNWTDKEVRTYAKLRVPSGWKVRPVSPQAVVKAFKSSSFKFEVVPAKGSTASTAIAASADLNLDGVRMNLKAETEKK